MGAGAARAEVARRARVAVMVENFMLRSWCVWEVDFDWDAGVDSEARLQRCCWRMERQAE